MKIRYTSCISIIGKWELKTGMWVECTRDIIIPGGYDEGQKRFTRQKCYKVTVVKTYPDGTKQDCSYFQIRDNQGKRAKIKFRRNKYFKIYENKL